MKVTTIHVEAGGKRVATFTAKRTSGMRHDKHGKIPCAKCSKHVGDEMWMPVFVADPMGGPGWCLACVLAFAHEDDNYIAAMS